MPEMIHTELWWGNLSCHLISSWFFLGLFFGPEDGGDMFLLYVDWLSTDYTALYPRTWYSGYLVIYRSWTPPLTSIVTSLRASGRRHVWFVPNLLVPNNSEAGLPIKGQVNQFTLLGLQRMLNVAAADKRSAVKLCNVLRTRVAYSKPPPPPKTKKFLYIIPTERCSLYTILRYSSIQHNHYNYAWDYVLTAPIERCIRWLRKYYFVGRWICQQ
jgi:hypothetical protein